MDEDERVQLQRYAGIRGNAARSEVKPGDTIPVAGLSVQVIASGGSVLPAPLTGQGVLNPLCSGFTPHGPEITSRAADPGDGRSVSLFLTHGRFRTVIMGDLTWNKEFDLMCPRNTLGDVDDGGFTITNSRTGFTKRYPPR